MPIAIPNKVIEKIIIRKSVIVQNKQHPKSSKIVLDTTNAVKINKNKQVIQHNKNSIIRTCIFNDYVLKQTW
jgi:hypothetical protein